MDWSHGYNVSTGYTYGFYRELAPDWINFGALLHGYRVPDASGEFRYVEFGCGQGFGLCLLAASYPQGTFLGIDFNPEHVAHARELAHVAGLRNVRFEEADFSALAQHWPADYGRFHYAVMHGIYSWVPSPVRRALVHCLDAALVPGGLVYNSYNTLPGWTSAIPLQHLLRRLQQQSAKSGPQIIRQGTELMQALLDAQAMVGPAMPPLRQRLESLKNQDPAYLVQEYLHENWHPMWFSQVADELAGAKLNHVGSATLPENYLPHLLPPALAGIVRTAESPVLQQELIDLSINQAFRRDLYCRGPRRLHDSMRQLGQYRLYAGRRPNAGVLRIPTSYTTLTIGAEFAEAVFEALAQGPQRIAELAALPAFGGRGLQEPIQVAMLLVHAGYAQLGRSQPGGAVDAFNRAVARRALGEHLPYGWLATRQTAGGVPVTEVDLVLHGIMTGDRVPEDPDDLATRIVDGLLAAGRTLVKDGKPLDTPEQRHAHAATLARAFLEQTRPVWQAAGVI